MTQKNYRLVHYYGSVKNRVLVALGLVLVGIVIGYAGSNFISDVSTQPPVGDNSSYDGGNESDFRNEPNNKSKKSGNDTSNTSGVVVDVEDGDTVDVRYEDGSVETLRIFGVDTPEKSTRLSGTREYGVPSTDSGTSCLDEKASRATEFAEKILLDKEVNVLDTSGENRGDFGRQLRYIVPKESDKKYGYMLLERGLARVYDNKGYFDELQVYRMAEKEAKVNRTGLWKCSVSDNGISVSEIRPDSFGDDMEAPTEFVEIVNTKGENISLKNLSLSDSDDNKFSLPQVKIQSGELIQIHTCTVSDYRQTLSFVWDTCSPIWNNRGDTVTIQSQSNYIIMPYE